MSTYKTITVSFRLGLSRLGIDRLGEYPITGEVFNKSGIRFIVSKDIDVNIKKDTIIFRTEKILDRTIKKKSINNRIIKQ